MEGWRPYKLGEFIHLKNGKSIKPGGIGSFPVYGSNGLIGGTETPNQENALIIGRVGAYCGSIMQCVSQFWASDNTMVAKPNPKIADQSYSYYLLKHANLNRHAGGAAQPLLTQSLLNPVEFHLPPLPIQKRIAGILSAYDDLIEVNTRRIKALEEMARRTYEEWFVSKVGNNWPMLRADEMIEFDPKTAVPKSGNKIFIPMTALSTQGMLIEETNFKTGNSGAKFQNNDTLFARITPCLENGKTAFVTILPDTQPTACGSTEFIVMRGKTVPPEFVYLLARSNSFREIAILSMSGATGRQRVRRESLEQIDLFQPPERLLNEFTKLVRPQFRLINSLANANQNLRAQRDLLLPRLISGEIDVSDAPMAEAAE